MVVTHVLVPCSKAAKLILLGYNMLPPKPAAEYAKESFELLVGDSCSPAEWQLKQLVLQLTDRDIEWVIHLGFYKLAYRSVSSTQFVLADQLLLPLLNVCKPHSLRPASHTLRSGP